MLSRLFRRECVGTSSSSAPANGATADCTKSRACRLEALVATLATLSLLSLLSLRERVYGSVGASPGADAAAEAGVFDIAPAGVDVAAVAIVVTAVNVASASPGAGDAL